MAGPTTAQIDALLNFLEEHRDLAHGSLRSVDGRTLSHRLWDEICTTLNAMGGCTKTTKQWQKVWTDKKHLAKKAAAAARRSASATGGGPSTAPSLSQWELKIVSIMGDGFGEPQTSARSQAFVEHPSQETYTAAAASTCSPSPSNQEDLSLLNETQTQLETSQQASAPPVSNASTTRSQLTSTRQRRESRRHPESLQAGSSVRDRLFRSDERRLILEEQRNVEIAGLRVAVVELCRQINVEIAGLRMAVVELCGHIEQIKVQLQSRV